MANNKVQLADGTVLLDLTGDTVTAGDMLQGTTAHDKSGSQIIGTLRAMTLDEIYAAVNTGWNSQYGLIDRTGEVENEFWKNTNGDVTIVSNSQGYCYRMIKPIRLLAEHTYRIYNIYRAFTFICVKDSTQIIASITDTGIGNPGDYIPTDDVDLYVTLDKHYDTSAYVYAIPND